MINHMYTIETFSLQFLIAFLTDSRSLGIVYDTNKFDR